MADAEIEARSRHLREQRERILALREKQRQEKLDKYLEEKRAKKAQTQAAVETEEGEGDIVEQPPQEIPSATSGAAMRKALASRIRREVRLRKSKPKS
jgi:hypothetical protein